MDFQRQADEPHQILIKSAFGIEREIAHELKSLGFDRLNIEDGELRVRGSAADFAVCNIGLRCAERVLVELAREEITDFDQLFELLQNIAWEDWCTKESVLLIDVDLVRSQIQSVRGTQSVSKRAICNRLSRVYRCTRLPESGSPVNIEITIKRNLCSVGINTSGDGLHRRGYRSISGSAPIRETLAAALLSIARWTPERPLFDPFCGTGTILIEAALAGVNRAPGLMRKFAIEQNGAGQAKEIADAFSEVRERFRNMEIPRKVELFGSDVDPGAIRAAKTNCERWGLKVSFEQIDFTRIVRDYSTSSMLITNLPYGVRMGSSSEIQSIYKSIRTHLNNERKPELSGFLTADQNFEAKIGRPASRRRKLYNAQLRADLYLYKSTA